MSAGILNFIEGELEAGPAEQGSRFLFVLTYAIDDVPVNLTGWTARMQVRTSTLATDTLLDLATGSGLTLGGTAGTVTIDVPSTTMDDVPVGSHVYDLELIPAGVEANAFKLVRGTFQVVAEVTR